MPEVKSIAFALDPTNTPTFLLDWELTKRCNLDCGYCRVGLFGGHDNSTEHPPLAECLQSIDFMYKYVDLYMQHRKPTQKKVILNVYGGESLTHPDIVEILTQCREKYKHYQDRWHLTVTCTTNGIIGNRRMQEIIPYIDEFTVSYHADVLPKQHSQFFENLLLIKQAGVRLKCVVMMHNDAALWEKSQAAVKFCGDHGIRAMPKPFDNDVDRWSYTPTQMQYFAKQWEAKSNRTIEIKVDNSCSSVNAIEQGRACCGGRKLSLNGDLKSSVVYVNKQNFRGWYCSVNWFFLFVRQLDGAIFSNKDCMTSLNGQVEPLGYISGSDQVLADLQTHMENKTMPVIQCVKDLCLCGYCAPKAESRSEFDSLIKRHVAVDVFDHD